MSGAVRTRSASIALALLVAGPMSAAPDPMLKAMEGAVSAPGNGPLQAFLFLTAMAFIPMFVIAATSFTRAIIVLSLTRQALGLQQTPPNSVLVTLALFITLFTMTPVLEKARTEAYEPYARKEIAVDVALQRGFEPFKAFMIRNTRKEDFEAVVAMAKVPMPTSSEQVTASVLVPAFMLSELRAAFLIGFAIFIPFLLVDLVVSAVLMSLGMIMVPPTTISLPLKILLFITINGWVLISQTIVASYGG